MLRHKLQRSGSVSDETVGIGETKHRGHRYSVSVSIILPFSPLSDTHSTCHFWVHLEQLINQLPLWDWPHGHFSSGLCVQERVTSGADLSVATVSDFSRGELGFELVTVPLAVDLVSRFTGDAGWPVIGRDLLGSPFFGFFFRDIITSMEVTNRSNSVMIIVSEW